MFAKQMTELDRILNLASYHIKEMATPQELKEDLETLMTATEVLMKIVRDSRVGYLPLMDSDQLKLGHYAMIFQRPTIYVFNEV